MTLTIKTTEMLLRKNNSLRQRVKRLTFRHHRFNLRNITITLKTLKRTKRMVHYLIMILQISENQEHKVLMPPYQLRIKDKTKLNNNNSNKFKNLIDLMINNQSLRNHSFQEVLGQLEVKRD
jgi:hypothetical protein